MCSIIPGTTIVEAFVERKTEMAVIDTDYYSKKNLEKV